MISFALLTGLLLAALAVCLAYIKRLTAKNAKLQAELDILGENINEAIKVKQQIDKNSSGSISDIRKRMRENASN